MELFVISWYAYLSYLVTAPTQPTCYWFSFRLYKFSFLSKNILFKRCSSFQVWNSFIFKVKIICLWNPTRLTTVRISARVLNTMPNSPRSAYTFLEWCLNRETGSKLRTWALLIPHLETDMKFPLISTAEAQDASRIYTVIQNYWCEAIYCINVSAIWGSKGWGGKDAMYSEQISLWKHIFQICLWKSSQCDLLANTVRPVETVAVSEFIFSLVFIL